MSDAEDENALQVEDVVEDLSRFLDDLGPETAPDREIRGRFARITRAITRLSERTWPDAPGPAHWRLAELRDVLVRNVPAEGLDAAASHRAWSELRAHIEPAYRAFVASLGAPDGGEAEEQAAAERSRPPNYVRNAYHVANAFMVVFLVEVVLTTWPMRIGVSSLAFVAAWGMELTRRRDPRINAFLMRVFRPVAHPHEADHVNSATWYATAILILGWLFPLDAGIVGVMVLGLADPAAAIVGRRFGRTPIGERRTLEGTFAFVVVGFAAACFALWLHGVLVPEEALVGPMMALALATAGAVGGAVGEVLARKIDDNLMIPVLSAASVVAVRWLGGGG